MNEEYKIGDVVLGNWTLNRLIGEGSYGKVYEATREDFGVTYTAAIKIITIPQNKSEVESVRSEGMDEKSVTAYFRSMVEEIVREFSLMSQLKGTANVVSYEDHVVIPHENEVGWDIIIRMELLTPLLKHPNHGSFTRGDVIKLGIDICKALELCQQFNIVHRDIKPENIFVSHLGDYKLGDFGIARTIDKTTSGLSKKGTYTYMAPEVYKENAYGRSVDIYSLGLVLYRLLNDNRAPFLPQYPEAITFNARETALARRMAGEPLPPPRHAGEQMAEIIRKACAYNAKERYSSPTEMREDLEAVMNAEEGLPSKVAVSADSTRNNEEDGKEGKTERAFVANRKVKEKTAAKEDEEERTTGVFGDGTGRPAQAEDPTKKSTKRLPFGVLCAIVAAVGILLTVGLFRNNSTNELISVPGVERLDVDSAKAQLEKLGFIVEVTETYDSSVGMGFVISQDAEVNTKLLRGETITLAVSKGPELSEKETKQAEKTIKIPDLAGKTQEEAEKLAKEAGLEVTVARSYDNAVPVNYVISQTPEAGTEVPSDWGVSISVSLGPVPQAEEKAPATTPKTPTATTEKKPVTITGISVKTKPTKTTYEKGETLNTSGLELTVQYSDGTSKKVTDGFTCNPTKLNTAGTQKITVTYKGKTTTFNATVKEKELTVTGVTVHTMPNKTVYTLGERMDFTGLKLKVTYSDGSTEVISSGFAIDAIILDTVGVHTFRMHYEGKEVAFKVTVKEKEAVLTGISVNTMPSKTTYNVGDSLNTNGLILTATYSDGSKKQITGGFTCDPTVLSSAGVNTITVTCEGSTTQFAVEVKEDVLTRYVVHRMPNKTSYTVGDTFDPTGFVLAIENPKTGRADLVYAENCEFLPRVLTEAGQQKISVIWYSVEVCSFYVTVEPQYAFVVPDEWVVVPPDDIFADYHWKED